MKLIKLCFAFLLISPMVSRGQSNGEITVIIQKIENENGTLRVGLFTENDKFLKEASYSKDVPASGQKNIRVSFEDIPFGTYAISIYHDLDDNGELDTNFIGIPKEPVGFSNDHQPKMGPPEFNGAKFALDQKTLTVTVNMFRY